MLLSIVTHRISQPPVRASGEDVARKLCNYHNVESLNSYGTHKYLVADVTGSYQSIYMDEKLILTSHAHNQPVVVQKQIFARQKKDKRLFLFDCSNSLILRF